MIVLEFRKENKTRNRTSSMRQRENVVVIKTPVAKLSSLVMMKITAWEMDAVGWEM